MREKLSWQEALSNLITDPKELFELLDLPVAWLQAAENATKLFPLKVTRQFVARMEKGNIEDPLLKQVLPLQAEYENTAEYQSDPLEEKSANPLPGLLHKYNGRVLVTLTSACAVHCRYCFRRHFPYAENNPGRLGWTDIFNYIRQDKTIHEVILSGGDPLATNDNMLKLFCDELETISHVKMIRFHTRLPIVLPERITSSFIEWLQKLSLQPVIVVHANHPRELDETVITALKALHHAHIPLFNQSVLLKGINDQVETLIELSKTLFSAGVLPYYLHTLDKVKGTKHFDLSLDEAKKLHHSLQQQLPGYLVPRLVCEKPGKGSKTLLASE